MTKEIIIKVGVRNEKCRTKAKKIAAESPGVNSMSMEGDERDQLVVTGDGIDSVKLVNILRKKLGHATIVSVQDVEAKEEKKEEDVKPVEYIGYYSACPPPSYYQRVVYDPYPSNGCFWF